MMFTKRQLEAMAAAAKAANDRLADDVGIIKARLSAVGHKDSSTAHPAEIGAIIFGGLYEILRAAAEAAPDDAA